MCPGTSNATEEKKYLYNTEHIINKAVGISVHGESKK
jgi:hypothetical protein